DGLTDDELAPWAAAAELHDATAGEQLVEHGDTPPGTFLFLEGTALLFRVDGDRVEPAGRQVSPTWLGAISVLTGGGLNVRVIAESDMRYAIIPTEEFVRLTLGCRIVHRRVMERIAPVMNRFAQMDQNRERLTSLGTMAAGIA